MPFEVVLSQQQQTEVRVVVSSEQDIDQPLNAVAQGKLENNGIDLNKTPRQKPKRKKHRPKVIQEGKPARTPKPTTPKPVNPSGKRKYVRRNKVQLYSENPSSEPGETVVPGSSSGTKSISSTKDKEDNPSGKRKYAWKKKVENSSDNALGMPGGTVDPESSHGTKSVRRCLNFDSEAARARDGCPESMQKFKINAESLAQEACLASNIIDIDVEPSAQYTRAMEVDNLVPGVPFVLDSSTDQMPNGYIRFVENPISHHQPCRREIVGTDQFLDECRTMAENPTTPPQPPKRENMKKLARKNFLSIVSNPERSQELGIIQLDSHETLNLLLTGTKGNHILDHDAQITTNTNFIHASNWVEKLGESHVASYHDPFLSQVNKRQRTEHENGFTYNTASSLMCLPSNVWRGHQVALNIAEAFPSADVQKIMGLKDQLASEGMLAFDQTENNTGKRLVLPLKPHSATSVSSMVDLSQMTKPGNQSGQNAMDHNNLSTPLQPFTDNGSQQSQNHEALTCMEAKVVSTKSRMKKKQSRKKEKAQPVNHLISASQVYLQGQKAASCTFEYCPAQKIMEATESHGASYHDPYLSQGYKRQRTEHENGFTSNTASSLMCLPSNDWRGHQVALNIAEAFPSADVQKIMGLTDQLASEGMLAFDQTENRTGKRLELPLKPHSATSASSMVDLSLMTKPGNQSGQNTMDHNNLSTPLETFAGNGSQQSQNHEALTCMEAKVVSTKSRMKTKQSRKKEKAQPVNHLINASQVYLQGQKAASCSFEYCPAQKIMEATASTSWDFRQEVSHTSCVGNLNSGAIVPYGDPLDDIIWKLRHLTVIGFCEADTAKVQNAIVPYGGDGVLVPYGGLFDLTKKRRPRPKVDLDPETNRVWNLLMGKEGGAVGEGTEIDKEKWWEEERRVFRGRVDSFIARMHLVQGDRRFSKWKGSVVDSVVGVFLTQNVSDHLSSSAFMALAARFPLKSKCNNSEFNTEERDSCIKHEDSCIVALDDTNKWQAQISHKELHDPSSLVIVEDNETANSNESFGSNTSGIVADHYSKVKCLNSKETVIGDSHDWPDTQLGTPVTLTGSATVAEAEDRWLMEDAGSSQNSSENPVQTADQIGILSNIRVEDLTIRSMCDVIDNSTSFTELLNSVLDVSGNLSDTISSMSKAITNLEDAKHVMPSVSAALPLPNHCNKSSSSQNSVSLQNSSENPVQTADQIGILSNIRVEDLTIRSMCDVIDNSTSFTELLNSVLDVSGNLRDPISSMSKSFTNLQDAKHVMPSVSAAPPLPNLCNESSSLGFVVMDCVNALSDESIFHQDLSSSGTKYTNKFTKMESLSNHSVGNISEVISQKNLAAIPGSLPTVNLYAPTCRHFVQPLVSPEAESYHRNQFYCSSNPQTDITEAPLGTTIYQKCSILQDDCTVKFQQEEKRLFEVERTKQSIQFQLQKQNFDNQQNFPNLHDDMNALEVSERVELDLKDNAYMSNKAAAESPKRKSKEKKVKDENERKKTYDWDSLRKEVHQDGTKMERSHNTMDSVDWEAVRSAEVNKISETIRERGMNNMLAERVKEFLNRLVRDHGSIDLEWLREIEPDKAKNYLLSIRGLGLKSVECVRLLTLHNLAFPVDTNVGRICVRLGWVPLQPLPESLQLHLLELYPVLETIQKYLWPRLCKLDQRTLYELHYQMITFGKVFCTKSKPNCNACPMRGECKHFASAFASARLALPGPEEKSLVSSAVPIALEKNHVPVLNPTHVPQLEGIINLQARAVLGNSEPIIEEPATPEPECIPLEESAIEDAFYEDPEEIPTITLNIEEFTQNLHNYMQANNMELQDVDMSKALVAINPEAASIPMPKLKNVSRLRTEHHVYELPDSHPLLEGLEPREPDDPSPYLLAIWTPGETAKSTEPPKASCNSQETGTFCNMATCFACNSRREAHAQIVRGTILIPCRTAMRGSFPLNGTYFQVNEVFADHDTSCNPIDVPREWIWNLPRRTVYFGTSIPTIFKGLTTEEIQLCFWRGFVCVRGFDRTTRAPKPLYARLHFPASKATRNKQQEISSSAKKTANN